MTTVGMAFVTGKQFKKTMNILLSSAINRKDQPGTQIAGCNMRIKTTNWCFISGNLNKWLYTEKSRNVQYQCNTCREWDIYFF